MIEWIVSSSVLIVLLIMIRTIFKGKIKLTLQYALWGIVLVRLLIPFSIGSTIISAANLKETAKQQPAVQTVIEIGNTSVSAQSYEDAYHQVAQQYQSNGIDVDALEGEALDAMELEVQAAMNGKTVTEILVGALTYVWIAGILVVGGMFLYTNIRFWKQLRKGRKNSGIQKGNIPVWHASNLNTPCLFGVFVPGIYVSQNVLDDPIRLRHILEHELTHYRHGDHIWPVLRGFCVALHWYNPLVWCAAFLSQRDAELACDEATIKRLGEQERAEYGRTLIAMTCRKKTNVLTTATTMNASKNGIKERIHLIAKKPKMVAVTLIVVLLFTAIAIGCTFTGPKEQDDIPVETLPTEQQSMIPIITTRPTEINKPEETTKPIETVEPTKPTRPWPYGNISDSDTQYPSVVADVVGMGPLYQDPMEGKICIGLFTTFTGEKQVYIIPENQEELLTAFKNAYSESSMGDQSPGPVRSMSIHFKGIRWYISSDGAIFLSNFGDDNILPPEASSELIALCEDARRKAGISDPVRPEDILQIKSATLSWNGVHTITDAERLKRIESLLSNSLNIGFMSACPYDSLLTLELVNGKTLTVAVANDSCGAWMSNGACYTFYPQDGSANDGNITFYKLFAPALFHKAAGGHMEIIADLIQYLDWDLYGEIYGDQETLYFIDQMKAWIMEDYEERVGYALYPTPDADSDYGRAFAIMLTQLYDENPQVFARICRNAVNNGHGENILRMLGDYWGVSTDEVLDILQEAISNP